MRDGNGAFFGGTNQRLIKTRFKTKRVHSVWNSVWYFLVKIVRVWGIRL